MRKDGPIYTVEPGGQAPVRFDRHLPANFPTDAAFLTLC